MDQKGRVTVETQLDLTVSVAWWSASGVPQAGVPLVGVHHLLAGTLEMWGMPEMLSQQHVVMVGLWVEVQ